MAGTTDVDVLLDSMTPEQFDEWEAKDLIEPVGYQTQMLASLAWMVHSYLSDGKTETTAEQWMPWLNYQQQQPANRQAKQLLNAIFDKGS